jgi:hypothetical protein
MTKYVVVKIDENGKELLETPCPMTKSEAEMLMYMMKNQFDGYEYGLKPTTKKSKFGTPDSHFRE